MGPLPGTPYILKFTHLQKHALFTKNLLSKAFVTDACNAALISKNEKACFSLTKT
jgi:hypothetical protein